MVSDANFEIEENYGNRIAGIKEKTFLYAQIDNEISRFEISAILIILLSPNYR